MSDQKSCRKIRAIPFVRNDLIFIGINSIFPLDQTLFSFFNVGFTLRQLLSFLALALLLYALWRVVKGGLLVYYFNRENVEPEWRQKIRSIVRRIFLALAVITFLKSLGIDRVLYTLESYQIRVSSIFLGGIVIELARILDWLTSKILIHKYYSNRDGVPERRSYLDNSEAVAGKTVQYMVYTIAAMVIIQVFNQNYELFTLPINDLRITVLSLFVIILIFLIAKLISWAITQLLLYSYYRNSDIDAGRRFAINKLITYVIYVIAIFVTIDNVGIELTVLWGGIAALLVGVGLGLQDVFRDLVSGIILLSDRSVKVHDVVSVNGQVGEVFKIGLRTSLVLARDETVLMVPNSQLVSNQVINWTHQNRRVRFSILVGVAYGSDPQKVKDILLACGSEHGRILKSPSPFVRFTNFGESSLDFELFFWSNSLMTIEDVMSQLRFSIAKAFKDQDIAIPFPQRDVWLKSTPE